MRYTRPAACAAGGRTAAPPCACAPRTAQPDCAHLPVMSFVPTQAWDCTYTCGQALTRGTLFPALDKPFMGKGGCCNG